jgi:coenzyme Q-binding protein COQ10
MPAHTEQQILPYNTQQLFDLVIDVERYPEFLPWCRAARIMQRGQGEFLGELVIAFKHLTERYTSRVVGVRPPSGFEECTIDVDMVEGPFEHLTNRWRFTPVEGGTRVDFALDFKFRSRMLEMMIGPIFSRATNKMIDAFKERADTLYVGKKA